MNFRRSSLILFFAGLGLLSVIRPAAADEPGTVVRLHWLGFKQISADTNSAPFMKVWQLPETAALVAQTLDKLSRLPGHGASNSVSALLPPLLDDLIASEFYLEISAATNSSLSAGGEGRGEVGLSHSPLLLALHLPADRARLWQTQLAAAASALSASNLLARIECSPAGDWTFVGVNLKLPVAQTPFAARLIRTRATATCTNWLEADLNPAQLISSLSAGGEGRGEVENSVTNRSEAGQPDGWGGLENLFALNSQLSTLHSLHLTVTGESGHVLTRANLELSRPLADPLPAWDIPTNLVHGPLTSFAAVRGIGAWLPALPAWQKLQLSPAPDQAVWWSRDGIPFQTYLAAPLPGASNQLAQLALRLVQNANPWLDTHADGSILPSDPLPGILWKNANLLSPFLISVESNQHDYLLGGLYPPNAGGPTLPPVQLSEAVRQQPNLVFGEVESTGTRVEDGLWITQVTRLVFHQPQMPHTAAGTKWLKAIETLLGESTTFVTRDGAHRLLVERRSTLGLDAAELHLLADWLESPQFPRGLHTFRAPPDN